MAKKRRYETVRELIYWSYANLAMAHTAVDRNQEKYGTFNYMISDGHFEKSLSWI